MGDSEEASLRREVSRLSQMVEELRADLDQCRAEVRRLSRAREEGASDPAAARRGARGLPSENIVKVNVGGRIFTTRRSTLCAVPGSFLEAMFSGRHKEEVDEDGVVFIDRDPTFFSAVLNWLRDPHAPMHFPNDPAFRHEVEYYGLAQHMLHREFLYVIGGERNFEERDLNTVFRYDSLYHEWTPVQSLSIPRSYLASAVLGNRIYAVGGHSSGVFQRSAERYDPDTNTWTAIADMNKPRSAPVCAVLDGKLFVIGGFDGHEVLSTVEAYDPENDKWEPRASLSVPRSGAACAVINGRIYVIGGQSGPISYDTVER